MRNLYVSALILLSIACPSFQAGEAKPFSNNPIEKKELPASKVIGQVLDSKTKLPLVGVSVYLTDKPYHSNTYTRQIFALPGAAINKDELPLSVTKEAGMFELSFKTLSMKELDLQIIAVNEAGNTLGQQTLKAYQGETVETMPIYLPSRVTAQVLDDKDQPVPNAVVTAGATPFTTDAEGRFTDPSVPAHRISWNVAAPGFEHKRHAYWIGDGVEKPVIKLVPCKGVSGKVIDAEGKPVKGVRIYGGQQYLNILPSWSTLSDENGEFVLGTVPEKGLSMPIFPAIERDIVGEVQQVEPGQKGLVLKLFPMGRFEGSVKDEKNQPLVKTNVRLMELGKRGKYWGVTDEKGELVIPKVAAGTYQAEVVPGGQPLQAPLPFKFTLDAGQTVKSTLVCSPLKVVAKKKLSGILLNSEGKPALHMRVAACYRMKGDPANTYQEGSAAIQADGRFEIELYQSNNENLRKRAPKPEGDDKVRIVAYLIAPDKRALDETREWAAAEMNLDAGTLKSSLEPERIFTLNAEYVKGGALKPGITKIVDGEGKDVSWRFLPVYTPGSNSLRVGVFKSGDLKAKLFDEASDLLDVVLPGLKVITKLDIMFPDPRIVDYLITDAGGKPLQGITLYKNNFPKDVYKGFTVSSDKDGKIHFECSAQAAGTFILYGSLNYEVFEGAIAAGSAPISQTIQLTSSRAKLMGQIRDADGNPLPKSNLYLAYSITDRRFSGSQIEVKPDGTYELFVPKNTKVSISGQSQIGQQHISGQTKQIVVAEGKTEMLDLVLRLHAQLPGRIPVAAPKAEKPAKPLPPPLEF